MKHLHFIILCFQYSADGKILINRQLWCYTLNIFNGWISVCELNKIVQKQKKTVETIHFSISPVGTFFDILWISSEWCTELGQAYIFQTLNMTFPNVLFFLFLSFKSSYFNEFHCQKAGFVLFCYKFHIAFTHVSDLWNQWTTILQCYFLSV